MTYGRSNKGLDRRDEMILMIIAIITPLAILLAILGM